MLSGVCLFPSLSICFNRLFLGDFSPYSGFEYANVNMMRSVPQDHDNAHKGKRYKGEIDNRD